MVPETRVFQATNGEDLVILAWTAFDWSTRVTDRQTDRQTDGQTDRIVMAKMRWKHYAVFTRKNTHSRFPWYHSL